MSHITKIETQITDLDVAERALVDLRLPSGDFGVGLQLAANGTYEVMSDWWYVERQAGVGRDDLLSRLYQRYSYLKVKEALDQHGFRISEESVDEQKPIRLEVVKWR